MAAATECLAQEDLEGLRDLDGKSLAVIELSPNWSRGGAGERDFRRRLEGLAQQAGRASRILFYVSMHGAVDEDETPCLVPPGASSVDSSTWIPVSRLLEAIKAQDIPEDVDKLLILDCARVPVNWRLGQLYNDFAAHLEAAVQEAGVPRLSLLNAAGPGQVSWTSQEMRGSVFGHYLRQGLAGDADTDGNRQISLDELYRFVRKHVQAWVRANRSAEQEPLLIADAGTRHHDLVWVTSDRLPARDPVAAEITLDELRTLWRQHDELAVWKPWSVDPVGYHDLQNRLLWLEQMATAGSAYGLKVNELKQALNGRFDGIRQRANAVQNQDLSLLRREVLTETRDPLGDGIEPRSLPLATFFSTIDRAQAEELTSQWQRFRGAEPVRAEGSPEQLRCRRPACFRFVGIDFSATASAAERRARRCGHVGRGPGLGGRLCRPPGGVNRPRFRRMCGRSIGCGIRLPRAICSGVLRRMP